MRKAHANFHAPEPVQTKRTPTVEEFDKMLSDAFQFAFMPQDEDELIEMLTGSESRVGLNRQIEIMEEHFGAVENW